MTMTAREFLDVRTHGFLRVAVIVPRVHLGKPNKNIRAHLEELRKVKAQGAMYALCPELGLSGYSCKDLFFHQILLQSSLRALQELLHETQDWNMLISVGMPLRIDGLLYNVAVTLWKGRILAVVPKAYPPNYREFEEGRHFARAALARSKTVIIHGEQVPFGTDILIRSTAMPDFVLHTDICEDLWVSIPPGTEAALAGAIVLANLSASNVTIGKFEYRESLVTASSGRNNAVQMYSAAGFGESTSDLAWDGHGIIAERGALLARSKRFELNGTSIVTDVDLDSLVAERMRQTSFAQNASDHRKDFRQVSFDGVLGLEGTAVYDTLLREIDPHPFVPSDPVKRDERCRETFMIQATSLARWLTQLSEDMRKVVIGVSGGQDSTHALLVAAYTMDLLKLPRTNIIAITMPGFGTTDRTYQNACTLIRALGATFREIKITPVVEQIFRDIGHDAEDESLVFENVQAWTRKVFELAVACKERGIDLGTGDLSELMLGWCTMFGDHAAHYAVNSGVPKTLISYLIRWTAEVIFTDDAKVQKVLYDILDTEISPELRRHKEGKITQRTEEIVGPYEVQDFTSYYFLKFGFAPSRIARLALHAFKGKYTIRELKRYLQIFVRRFFQSQLKRSVLPLGPKVGLGAVSPRGDLRVPADIDPDIWLEDVARVPDEAAG